MCETSARATSTSPRWGVLYVLTLAPLAAIAALEAVPLPEVVRETVRCLLALVAFAGMAVWIRRNRVALDLARGCACEAQYLTVRETDAHRPSVPIGVSAPPADVRTDDEALLPR